MDSIDDAQTRAAHFLAESLDRADRTRKLPAPPQRIKGGVVVCANCGKAIPPARLKALPGASRCVGCQEEAEHAP
jgi:phage/conjugal plasmid C-4 type zinc finger TraR family protein